VVLVRTDGEGEKYLCAYIVPVDPGPGAIDHASLAAEWRDFLSEKLPAYMIPAHFVCLDRLPLTPNGKIDRRGLPEPGKKAGQSYVAPRNTIEEWFVSQWSKILGIQSEEIGIDDDFFRLGGHSLKATTLMSRIRGEFHLELPLVEIFKGPTIRKLASIVQAIGGPDGKNDGAKDDLEEFTL
jgi:bacitracin synthase 3